MTDRSAVAEFDTSAARAASDSTGVEFGNSRAVMVTGISKRMAAGVTDLMMEVPLADGHSLVVEVDRREVPGELVLAAAKPYEVAVRATETLEQTLEKARPALHSRSEWAKSAGPDECCVEFGPKLGGEMGPTLNCLMDLLR